MTMDQQAETESFIQKRLHLVAAPGVPEILLYRAHAKSGLTAFVGEDGLPPYWAYGWAGGTVLARYILDHAEVVKGRRVLDIGAGSGIVGIAAAMAGAAKVESIDCDPLAAAAARLNAKANHVAITVRQGDGLCAPMEDVDLIAMGDMFYDEALARRAHEFLAQSCRGGVDALIGDPGRKPLPSRGMSKIAEYQVPDFGQQGLVPAAVYAFHG